MALTDLPGLIPVSCSVVFQRTDDGDITDAPWVKTITLASLALSEFTGVTTNANTKVLHSSAVAKFLGGAGTPDNNTEINALANKIATDWYRWQLCKQSIAFGGVVPITLEGTVDAVEWTWETPIPRTRLIRPEFNDWGNPGGGVASAGGSVVNYITYLTVNEFNTNIFVVNQYFYDYSIHIVNNYYVYVDTVTVPVVMNVCPVNKTVSKVATGTTTINSTSETDITGSSSTFTLATAQVCFLVAKIEWDGNGAATVGETFGAYVNVDGTTNTTTFAKTYVIHASQIIDGCITLSLGSLAAGSHTIKLRAKRLTGAGSIVVGVNTSWTLHAETALSVAKRNIYVPASTPYGPEVCSYTQVCCDSGDPPVDPPDDPLGDCDQSCPAVCTDQPTAWSVTIAGISGYTGGINPNGAYTLSPIAPCLYEGTNGSGFTIRLGIVNFGGGSGYFILYSYGNGGTNPDYFSYLSAVTQGIPFNCCQEIDFIYPSSSAHLTVQATQTATPDDCCDGEVTDCCEGVGIPNTLVATITEKTGDCSCWSNTYTLERSAPGVWTSTANVCSTGSPLVLTCNGTSIDDWEISTAWFGLDGPDAGSTCSPLSLIWAGETPFGVCTGTIKVTITE